MNSSVNVTCIFAINASASACWIIFINESFGFSFSGIVQHSLPASTGLIHIPNNLLQLEIVQQLGSVVFDAKVYDMSMDGNVTDYPAFEQEEALVIQALPPNPDRSPSIIGNK